MSHANNVVLNNLSVIASAAEYFDKATGSMWRLKNLLTSPAIWAAYRLTQMSDMQDSDEYTNQRVKVDTLTTLMQYAIHDGFPLDIDPQSVARSLGLGREADPHVEASKLAREKCMRTRTPSRFAEFYHANLHSLEERRLAKEQSCDEISALIGRSPDEIGFKQEIDANGDTHAVTYCDEEAIGPELDKMTEQIAHVVLLLKTECDVQMAGAITADRITRLQAFDASIKIMMEHLGIDQDKLKVNNAQLKAMIKEEEKKIGLSQKELADEIEAQAAALAAPSKPKKRVKAADAKKA